MEKQDISYKAFWGILLFFALVLSVGCSTQFREAEPQETDEVVLQEIYAEMRAQVSGFGFSASAFDIIYDDKSSAFYHVRDSESRPAPSVLSLLYMDFLNGFSFENQTTNIGLLNVDVVFVDGIDQATQERTFTLSIKMETQSGPIFNFAVSDPGAYEFTDDRFEVSMTTDNRTKIVLVTNDLHEEYSDELGSSIKLDIYVIDNGQDFYAGQVSTMAGYGGIVQ